MFYNTIIGAILAAVAGVQAGEVLLVRQFEHRLQHPGQANGTARVVSAAEQGLPSWETVSWAEKAPLTEVRLFNNAEDHALTVTIPKSRSAENVEPTEGLAAPEVTKTPAEDAPEPPQTETEAKEEEAPILWHFSDFLAVGMSVVVTATVFAAAA